MMTREELYRLVWSESPLSLAPKLGVSDVYIRKVCAALEVPRPGRGYWRKRAVGRAPPTPDLPPLRPGSPDRWSRDRTDFMQLKPFYERSFVREVKGDAAEHPLVAAALPLFGAVAAGLKPSRVVARPDRAGDDNSGELVDAGTAMDADDAADAAAVAAVYLELPKRFQVIDVTVSRGMLPASLDLADKLYRAIEARGHRVLIAGVFEPFALYPVHRDTVIFGYPEGPQAGTARRRPTVAYVGRTPFGLAVLEISGKMRLHYAGYGRFLSETQWKKRRRGGNTWTVDRWVPSGLLRVVAYSPFSSVPWRQEWSESRKGQLAKRVETIAADLEAVASRIGDWGAGP